MLILIMRIDMGHIIFHPTSTKNDIRYQNGEVQLDSALIAACQQQYSKFSSDMISKAMYGINI
jgi:hypothetical protein